mmetsp:Transcript_126850/g.317015  ORF Transcript_126850/g.317015 Transcript_126850/m.317015 type:complete len:734 (-) Transcript_126850:281-2482(-)
MLSVGLSLNAVNLPVKDLAFTNKAYASEVTLAQLCGGPCKTTLADVNGCTFTIEAHAGVAENGIALNLVQRGHAKIGLNQEVFVKAFSPPKGFELGVLKVDVDFFQPKPDTKRVEIKDEDLEKIVRKSFSGQVFTNGQPFVMDYQSQLLKLTVISLAPPDLGEDKVPKQVTSGILAEHTEMDWQNGPSGKLHVLSNKVQQRNIFRPDFNFEELGIGGLDKEFSNIFRRAFAARVFPPHVVRDLGITHVRGMLLHGPPGTGKTLIARQLAKFLKAAEPKIVNGPEILNKYVGQAEENIRNLFADAEKEYKQEGENSQLHVIIFDEIDSICKARGSKADSTGVHDSIVNQLLSKIDGVDALNNILLIGMTNRKDLIDEALLRPGRLEVHVEISLPDENGRTQILNIHTKSMREKGYLDPSVSIPAIAASTKNFSGAELAGLVRSATSFALNRKVNVTNTVAPSKDLGSIKVTNEDFETAMLETKPLFGQHDDEFEQCARLGIMHFSQDFEHMLHSCQSLIEQVRSSENTPLLTCLLYGSPGCGKTALAAHLAQSSDFPFVRRIGPESYVGYTEQGKVSAITKIFEDAYKSPLSVIVLDDLERLMDYVPIGPRFSVHVLSALFSLLKKQPPKSGRRLLIIGTTSAKEFLQDTEILRAFNVTLNVPMLSSPDHVRFVLEKRPGFRALVVAEICAELSKQAQVLSISTLLLVAEMALQRQDPVSKQVFMDCLRVAGDA